MEMSVRARRPWQCLQLFGKTARSYQIEFLKAPIFIISSYSTGEYNAHSPSHQTSLGILATLAQDSCCKYYTTKVCGSLPCTSAGQTAAPMAFYSSLLDITHADTCSAFHPLLSLSDNFFVGNYLPSPPVYLPLYLSPLQPTLVQCFLCYISEKHATTLENCFTFVVNL